MSQPQSSLWLSYALATVFSWGLYGVLLHLGQMGMADPANGRMKAFLLVGVAYFLVAVLAPLFLLVKGGADWTYPSKGLWFSLLAGTAGAIGALCVLLAFGAKGNPAVVMSIIFAGAPIVNAIVAMLVHPPPGGVSALKPQFLAGILLAAVGGLLVMRYRPGAPPPGASTPAGQAQEAPEKH
jgi:drug/metabolite transporter (DMT)-like permease